MRFEFHPDALAEYEDAARYYAGCRAGLELRFIACVESAIRRILENPGRGSFFEHEVRRCLTHIFPYAILYTIEPDYVLVVAVMHCHRKPGFWRTRLKPS